MFISNIFISVLVLFCTESSYANDVETHPNVNLLPDSCGDVSYRRILGGNFANIYEFPWMALISFNTRNGPQFSCAGTIVNSKYILTAAHCVDTKKVLGVRIGEFDLNSKVDCQGGEPQLVCESHLQDIQVENIILHQNFSKPTSRNDIALIRLKKPIDFQYKNAFPICLPVTQKLQNVLLAGTTGTVAGWGDIETKVASGVLLKADISIKTDEECRGILYNISSEGDIERVLKNICAGEDGQDSCKGDSGGPLMVVGIYKEGYRYIQYGIVSGGPKECGSKPEVYTDVSKYMGWILDNIKE